MPQYLNICRRCTDVRSVQSFSATQFRTYGTVCIFCGESGKTFKRGKVEMVEPRILDDWIRPRLSFMTPLSDDISCRFLCLLLLKPARQLQRLHVSSRHAAQASSHSCVTLAQGGNICKTLPDMLFGRRVAWRFHQCQSRHLIPTGVVASYDFLTKRRLL